MLEEAAVIKKRKVICFVMAALLLPGIYFMRGPSSENVAPENSIETLPPIENAMPSKNADNSTKEEGNSTKAEKQSPISPTPTENVKIEKSSSLTPAPGESVNLEEQSYSIKTKKREIPITPGVSLQPGKSINVKIPGQEEIIRVQRDKVYHPGGYNVLWEKKY